MSKNYNSSLLPQARTNVQLCLRFKRLPVNGDGHEGEDRGADGEHGHELSDFAVDVSERPVVVEHVGVVEGDVERGHHGVSDGEVHEEVVGDGSHPLVRQDDPDDNEIPSSSHHHDSCEEHAPDDLSPPGQDKRVRFHGVLGRIPPGLGDILPGLGAVLAHPRIFIFLLRAKFETNYTSTWGGDFYFHPSVYLTAH